MKAGQRAQEARKNGNGVTATIDIYIPRRAINEQREQMLRHKISVLQAWIEENFNAVVRHYID